MSKKKAFFVHFCLSLLVVSTCIAVVFVAWYPGLYFHVFNAAGILKILVGVDLVLGPLLTLIVFKPGKPGLRFDLAVIAAVQISALGYGLTVAYTERPYFTVFAVDRFEVLAKPDVDIAAIDPAILSTKPLFGPALVVAKMPEDAHEIQRLLEETMFEGKPDLHMRPEFWLPFEEVADLVLSNASPLAELRSSDGALAAEIQALLDAHGTGLVYVPIMGKQRVFSLVLNPATLEPLGILDVDPWDATQTAADTG